MDVTGNSVQSVCHHEAAAAAAGRQADLWVLDEGGEVDDRAIQHCKQQDGDTGEDHVVGGSTDAVHQSLPTEAIVELVEEEHKGKADILVEGIFDETGETVAGEAAVHQ